KYVRTLFIIGARAVLAKPGSWAKFGLQGWLADAAKRLHHNVLAAALANKLARIAWSVLYHGRSRNASRVQSLWKISCPGQRGGDRLWLEVSRECMITASRRASATLAFFMP